MDFVTVDKIVDGEKLVTRTLMLKRKRFFTADKFERQKKKIKNQDTSPQTVWKRRTKILFRGQSRRNKNKIIRVAEWWVQLPTKCIIHGV